MANKKKDTFCYANLQNTTHKTKDRITGIPLDTGGGLRCPERVSSSCSTSDSRRVSLVTNPALVCG